MDYEEVECFYQKNGRCSFYAEYKEEVDMLFKVIDLMAQDLDKAKLPDNLDGISIEEYYKDLASRE